MPSEVNLCPVSAVSGVETESLRGVRRDATVFYEIGGDAVKASDSARDQSPGWLWGDPNEGEEFMRTIPRNLERTTRAMVGRPDLFSAEDLRLTGSA
jgi:hypothetical protein